MADRMLRSALIYASWGWPIFLLAPETKIPPEGSHGFKDATTDHAQIRQRFAELPGANIGLATGLIVAIDQDIKSGADGIASWRDLQARHSINDNTLTSWTPSGGQHLIYAANGHKIRCSAGKLAPGVDVRGYGGYILLPPSRLASGGMYCWDVCHHPGDMRPAPLPPILAELLAPPKPTLRPAIMPTNGNGYAMAALRDELATLARTPEGNRNHQLNRAAFNLGQLAAAELLDRKEVAQQLEDVALAIGLVASEIRATVASGLGAGMRTPRGGRL